MASSPCQKPSWPPSWQSTRTTPVQANPNFVRPSQDSCWLLWISLDRLLTKLKPELRRKEYKHQKQGQRYEKSIPLDYAREWWWGLFRWEGGGGGWSKNNEKRRRKKLVISTKNKKEQERKKKKERIGQTATARTEYLNSTHGKNTQKMMMGKLNLQKKKNKRKEGNTEEGKMSGVSTDWVWLGWGHWLVTLQSWSQGSWRVLTMIDLDWLLKSLEEVRSKEVEAFFEIDFSSPSGWYAGSAAKFSS